MADCAQDVPAKISVVGICGSIREGGSTKQALEVRPQPGRRRAVRLGMHHLCAANCWLA